MNSEICLRIIYDRASAYRWFQSTFLAVRMEKNQSYYASQNQTSGAISMDGNAEQVVTNALQALREDGLIQDGTDLLSSEFGHSMTRYCVKIQTMRRILSLLKKNDIPSILFALSAAEELCALRLKCHEKRFYQILNGSCEIRYPVKVEIASVEHKVTILIQAILGDVSIPTGREFQQCKIQFDQDVKTVFGVINRLVRCLIDCQVHARQGGGARIALELARSIAARAWDDSPFQMRQITGIGPVAVKKLIGAGILSLEELTATEPHRINVIMGRQSGFGEALAKQLCEFPKLCVSVKLAERTDGDSRRAQIRVQVDIGFINEKVPGMFNRKPVYVCFLAERSDGLLLDFKRMPAKYAAKHSLYFTAQMAECASSISCYAMCDEIAGSLKFAELQVQLPDRWRGGDIRAFRNRESQAVRVALPQLARYGGIGYYQANVNSSQEERLKGQALAHSPISEKVADASTIFDIVKGNELDERAPKRQKFALPDTLDEALNSDLGDPYIGNPLGTKDAGKKQEGGMLAIEPTTGDFSSHFAPERIDICSRRYISERSKQTAGVDGKETFPSLEEVSGCLAEADVNLASTASVALKADDEIDLRILNSFRDVAKIIRTAATDI